MNVLFTIQNEQILLRADVQNYELCHLKNRTDADGNVTAGWETFKFFASLPQALNRLLDMKVRASEAKNLKQLAADLEAARVEIMAAWGTETKSGCQCKNALY
jgi:hypothetical protein